MCMYPSYWMILIQFIDLIPGVNRVLVFSLRIKIFFFVSFSSTTLYKYKVADKISILESRLYLQTYT